MKGVRFQALTADDLTALADGGRAECASLATLRSGQLAKHKLLVRGVVRLGGQAVPDAAPQLREHYELLASMEESAPDTVADVLSYPHVGAWAARCLRALTAASPAAMRTELDYLGAVAAAAAIRTGYACTISLRSRAGTIMLPGLGRALLPAGRPAHLTVSGPMRATIAAGDQTIVIRGHPHRDSPGWQGLRRLRFGDGSIVLDDLDPYRDYGRCRLTGRLDDADVGRWQRALDQAWLLLRQDYADYAAVLRDGLISLIPIKLGAGERNLSATSGDAFAAVAASTPPDGVALALALVHEFQHAKLCAVIHLEPLFNRHGGELFYAPWRPDPRPAGALLQGIYAHMGVADFWRVRRRTATGAERTVAEIEFARWLRQTLDAASRLQGHPELTAAGQHLLSCIAARLTGWLAEAVPVPARALAEITASDHRSCWQLRNLAPDPEDVAMLARDWRAGKPAYGIVRTRVCPPAHDSGRNARTDLLYLKVRDPARFDSATAGGRDDPDVAYATGDRADAIRGYLDQLKADPASQHAWTGLGLASGLVALVRCPEVVYAVYHKLSTGPDPQAPQATDVAPLRLAEWLGAVSTAPAISQV